MSSNSDSNEAVEKGEETSRNLTFVKLLKEYPIILSKSQVPSVQQQKTPAKVEFAKRWTKATGESITPGTLIKKLHNLKSRTIQKSDMNKTGNRKVRLADWELLLLGHLKPDINPSVLLTVVWSIPMSSETPFCNPGSAMYRRNTSICCFGVSAPPRFSEPSPVKCSESQRMFSSSYR
jgi:hypothetical protein